MGLLRFLSSAGCAALILAAGPPGGSAEAQTVSAAPPVETRISLWSESDWRGRNDLLRRARPDGDMAGWMAATDPLIAFVSEPAWNGVVVLSMTLSPEGRLTGCEIPTQPHDLPPEAVAGLCDRLAPQVRYHPALTADGERVGDRVRFLIRSGQYLTSSNLPLIRAEPLPPAPPAPMPGPGWPPLVSLTPARLVDGLPLLEGGGDAPEAAGTPWAGIEVQLGPTGAVAGCRTINSSGDARFDQQACAAARRAGYALNGATSERDRRVYLLIVRQGGVLRALPQSRTGRSQPVPEEAARAEMAAAWGERRWPRVFVSVGAAGTPTDCRINESSGEDGLDVEACLLVRRTARFAPARDSLGRATAGSLFLTLSATR